MLRAFVRTSSSKICTTRTTATSSLYRCSTLRTFCGAVENDKKSDKETDELKLHANQAIVDAKGLIRDHQRSIDDFNLRVTRLDKAVESNDVRQILNELYPLKKQLGIESISPSRKEFTFPTEVTALLLQRFGGKPSVWIGRYLRVYQMKMFKYQVNPLDVSDRSANHTLARAIVSSLVLSLLFLF